MAIMAQRKGVIHLRSVAVGFLMGVCCTTWFHPHGYVSYECIGFEARDCAASTKDKALGWIEPLERTPVREYLPGKHTDAYTFFHHYYNRLGNEGFQPLTNFSDLPQAHIWTRYFEGYHNHWSRYRGKDSIVFLEIGVQSGGKIPLLREYFGPGFTYIGLDINPSTKMFDNGDWIHVEIGDTGNREFLDSIVQKYPKVDLFLDDGGHQMHQQRLSMEVLLPHVKDDGVFMCEDLSTSWSRAFHGIPYADEQTPEFASSTMMGLVHRSINWLQSGWIQGKEMHFQYEGVPKLDERWSDTPWWKDFVKTVKHIHIYNQLVVYEKGLVEDPVPIKTVGKRIQYKDSGVHESVVWSPILERLEEEMKRQPHSRPLTKTDSLEYTQE